MEQSHGTVPWKGFHPPLQHHYHNSALCIHLDVETTLQNMLEITLHSLVSGRVTLVTIHFAIKPL